ncbi:MAG TPA: hypothetical protein VN943_00480 [Candidatus Acidoferrum sp.]|nr:hypothetical protein [Candidatus Acidoferrum sp.]
MLDERTPTYRPARSPRCTKRDTTRAARNARYYAKKIRNPAWKKKHRADCRRRMHAKLPQLAERHFRFAHTKQTKAHEEAIVIAGMRTVSAAHLRNPRFTYIDASGTIHAEFWESAEQMIVRLETARKKGSHKEAGPA